MFINSCEIVVSWAVVCSLLSLLSPLGVCWFTVLDMTHYFLLFICASHEMYSFLCSRDGDNLPSFSICSFTLGTTCSDSLAVLDCLCLCLSWNVLISQSVFKDSFSGYNNLGWKSFTFRTMLSCMLMLLVRDLILVDIFVSRLTFPFFHILVLFSYIFES